MTPDAASTPDSTRPDADPAPRNTDAAPDESRRSKTGNYPISRWYVIPVTERIAARLAPTAVRPTHLTVIGLTLGLSGTVLLIAAPSAGPAAAAFVLAAWFMDRTDGLLARRQQTASPFGTWLDANVDELHDVVWHIAAACAAATLGNTQLPWFLLIAFLAGKYLFMNGLNEERALSDAADENPYTGHSKPGIWLRAVYHLPGNADIRLHLLIAALVTGMMTAELALVAAYYNLRWIVRFGLVARRLGGRP